MPSYWSFGPASASADEGGITFDCSGTPMDQDWYCRFEELARKADILRQTWPEEMLVEMFVEAARCVPGLSSVPPPPKPEPKAT